jgi:DNA polymerase I-like protein with 3'-5' exonuclease and polymerase domains
VAAIVKDCMESAVRLVVPLEVKMKIGKTWGSLKNYSM